MYWNSVHGWAFAGCCRANSLWSAKCGVHRCGQFRDEGARGCPRIAQHDFIFIPGAGCKFEHERAKLHCCMSRFRTFVGQVMQLLTFCLLRFFCLQFPTTRFIFIFDSGKASSLDGICTAPYDVIIASDLVYSAMGARLLARSVADNLKPGGVFLMVRLCRQGHLLRAPLSHQYLHVAAH